MLREIKTNRLNFLARAKSNHSFHQICDNYGAHDRKGQRKSDGFKLLDPERVPNDVPEVCIQVGIDIRSCKKPGKQGSQRSTNGMHAKGVKRIVIFKPPFDLVAEEPRDNARRQTNDESTLRIDETASRCHHDETRHRA